MMSKNGRVNIAILYFCILSMSAVTLWYSTYTSRETGRKFCDIITTVNAAYKDGPEPTTELGKKIKVQYADLEKRLDC